MRLKPGERAAAYWIKSTRSNDSESVNPSQGELKLIVNQGAVIMTRHNAIRRAIIATLALAVSLSLGSREMRAQKHEVRIAAAADLQFAMSDLHSPI